MSETGQYFSVEKVISKEGKNIATMTYHAGSDGIQTLDNKTCEKEVPNYPNLSINANASIEALHASNGLRFVKANDVSKLYDQAHVAASKNYADNYSQEIAMMCRSR